MKHTPGPWKIETHNNKIEVWSNNQFIATPHHDLFFSAEKHGNIEANAKLIASAPDMLEALNTLKIELAKLHGDEFKVWVAAGKPTDNTTTLNMLSMLVGKCTQVIHKATGETK